MKNISISIIFWSISPKISVSGCSQHFPNLQFPWQCSLSIRSKELGSLINAVGHRTTSLHLDALFPSFSLFQYYPISLDFLNLPPFNPKFNFWKHIVGKTISADFEPLHPWQEKGPRRGRGRKIGKLLEVGTLVGTLVHCSVRTLVQFYNKNIFTYWEFIFLHQTRVVFYIKIWKTKNICGQQISIIMWVQK